MAEPKTVTYVFGNNGIVEKLNASQMQPGMYRKLLNMESLKEGQLTTRRGSKLLGSMGAHLTEIPIKIAKLSLTRDEKKSDPGYDGNGNPITQPRFIGLDDAAVYVTNDYMPAFTQVATGLGTVTAGAAYRKFLQQRWNAVDYSPNSTGTPVLFLGSPLKMLKSIQGSPATAMAAWGITPAFGVAKAVDAGSAGLPDTSANGSTPYDYLFTYQAADGTEGNPSQPMSPASEVVNGVPIDVTLRQITVTVIDTDDAQISKIAIYRRGGILFDAYRLVGYVACTHVLAAAITFTDNIGDVELANSGARQVDYFNDPPVVSAVPTVKRSTVATTAVTAGLFAVESAASMFTGVYPGTLMHFVDNNPEDVVIIAVADSTHATIWAQRTHAIGATMEINAITAQPCYLVMRYGEQLVVAGDPNNLHVMYMSRAGSPESFPLLDATGARLSQPVGTPANGIVNMTEFRGAILSMNVSSFFNVYTQGGGFFGAVEVTAAKGLGAPYGWCNTGDEIWYYAPDGGIWSWNGGSSTKRSEAIDLLFKGIPVFDMPPVDTSPAALVYIMMEYTDGGQIRFLYKDINGLFQILVCEPLYGDRWRLEDRTALDSGSAPMPTTLLYQEKDLGIMIAGRKNSDAGPTFSLINSGEVIFGNYFTSDEYSRTTNNPKTSGGFFAYEIELPWFDMGSPFMMKNILEAWLEVDPNIPNTWFTGYEPITIEPLVDYLENPLALDPVIIQSPNGIGFQGRMLYGLLPNSSAFGSTVQSFGREGRAFSWRISSNAYAYVQTFFSLTIKYVETGLLTAGGCEDWNNLGTKWDKKLYQITIEFDSRGVGQSVYIDTISGKNGSVYHSSVQLFLLDQASGDINYGSGRMLKTMPITDGIVVKEVRVRKVTELADPAHPDYANRSFFTIYNVDFEKEEYPPDVVTFTPEETGGYAYAKYANQLTLEVNTNGQDVLVQVQADGATVETVTVNTTLTTRRTNITLAGNLLGFQWRIYVDPSQATLATGTGMFQLWQRGPIFRFQQADVGEVMHSSDWDDLGSPNDKQVENVVFSWDNTGGSAPVTFRCDMIKGLGGQTLANNVLPEQGVIVLDGGRGKKEYSFAKDIFCKMLKFYPVGLVPPGFKNWKYVVKSMPDPPDIVPWTPWSDQGYAYGKTARNVIITVDTGSIDATFDLEADGVVTQTFSINTSYTDRRRVIACNPNLSGKLWRIVNHPGTNGLFKLWDFQLDYVKEPPAISQWSSYGIGFNYRGLKLLKMAWIDYQSASPIVVTVTAVSTNGVFTVTLPAHPTRAVERFLFTSVWGTGLNKSALYDIFIAAQSGTFQLWADVSGVEVIPCGVDRHGGYTQITLSEFMAPAV